MQKTLKMTCAALFAAVMLMAAVPASSAPAMQPKPAAMAPVAPVPAAMVPEPAVAPMVAVAAMQPTMEAVPAKPTTKPDAKKDSTGSVVGGSLLQILIVILTIALPVVLTPLVKWLLKKMKVEDLQTQQMIDGIVDQAVVMGLNYANEQAHKLGDNPVKGAAKLAVARDKALKYLEDSGIVGKGAEYIEDLIEAKLGATREDKPAESKPTEAAEDKSE